GPELAGVRVDRGTLDVAMPVRPDLGSRTLAADEWIVRGHAAVALDPHDLAQVRIETLCAVAILLALAEGDEKPSVAGKRKPRPVVSVARHRGLLLKDHVDIGQRIGLRAQPAACHGGRADLVARLGVRDVHEAVLLEIRVDRDVEQTALSRAIDFRYAGQ